MSTRLRHLIAITTSAALTLVSCAPLPGLGSSHPSGLTPTFQPFSLKRLRPSYSGDVVIDVNTGLSTSASFRTSARSGQPAKRFRLAGGRFGVRHDGNPHPTPNQHERDQMPYFAPDDPATLAGLEPAEGDVPMGDTAVSFLKVNDSPPEMTEAAILDIFPTGSGDASLQALCQQYGGTVQRKIGYFYEVKFDLSRVSLANFEDVIRKANEFNQTPVTNVEVSSLQAAKLLKLASELIGTRQDLVAGVEFNRASPTPATPVEGPYGGKMPIHGASDSIGAPNLPDPNVGGVHTYWWLKDANIVSAWDYGYGGGVTVAYIDSGFKLNGNKEFSRRTDKSKMTRFTRSSGGVQGDATFDVENPREFDYPHRWHGVFGMAAGFAEMDNYLGAPKNPSSVFDIHGTVGSAPNATLIPFNCGWTNDYIDALGRALDLKVDVIVLNQNYPPSPWWSYAIVGIGGVVDLVQLLMWYEPITRLFKTEIPLIIPAHNSHEDASRWLPGYWSAATDHKNVITVGALEKDSSSGNVWKAKYSNYGPAISIWAPVDNSFVSDLPAPYSDPFTDGGTSPQNKNLDPYLPVAFGGTSFAAPMTGGAVALIVGAVKRATGAVPTANELRDALQYTAGTVAPKAWDGQNNDQAFIGLPILNARGTIERILTNNNKNPKDFLPIEIEGNVERRGDKLTLIDATGKSRPILPYSQRLIDEQTDGASVQKRVIGLRFQDGYLNDTIEAAEIDTKPFGTKAFRLASADAVLKSVSVSLVGSSDTGLSETARTNGICLLDRQPGTGSYVSRYLSSNGVQSAISQIIGWGTSANIASPGGPPISGPFYGKAGPVTLVQWPGRWVAVSMDTVGGYSGSYTGSWTSSVSFGPIGVVTYNSGQSGTLYPGYRYWIASASSTADYVTDWSLSWHEAVDFGPGGPNVRASDSFDNPQLGQMCDGLQSNQDMPASESKNAIMGQFTPVGSTPSGAVVWQQNDDGTYSPKEI